MPKDFLGQAAAGGACLTRALAATLKKWPKMLRSWRKPLGIQAIAGARAHATIVLLLTRGCGIVATKDD